MLKYGCLFVPFTKRKSFVNKFDHFITLMITMLSRERSYIKLMHGVPENASSSVCLRSHKDKA